MTQEQTQETHGEPAVAPPVADFQAIIDEAAEFAQQSKAAPPATPRVSYAGHVRDVLGEEPDAGPALLIRRVLGAMDVRSSGMDAMSDDELLQVVRVGQRVLDIYRANQRAAKAAASAPC